MGLSGAEGSRRHKAQACCGDDACSHHAQRCHLLCKNTHLLGALQSCGGAGGEQARLAQPQRLAPQAVARGAGCGRHEALGPWGPPQRRPGEHLQHV
jgi:hypothetical protein